ncbi:MAG: hypothetical protein ABJA87_09035, partial [bacterium]
MDVPVVQDGAARQVRLNHSAPRAWRSSLRTDVFGVAAAVLLRVGEDRRGLAWRSPTVVCRESLLSSASPQASRRQAG